MAKETKAILRDIAEVLVALTVFGVLLWLFLTLVSGVFGAARAEEGIGHATTCLRAQEAEGEYESAKEETEALKRYVEGEGQPPEWYRPDEEMAVEWTETKRRDIGCPDYAYETLIYGWDGHVCESWEMTLYARIVYLEVWGQSRACCEAVADSILQLWDSGYFGTTLGGLLSATAEDGSLVYSPYAYVWDWDYDAEGLAEIQALCEERFVNGPTWDAPYFRLWYYHPWAEPAYEIDGVYFSRGR